MITVVGAGVVGASVAYHLALAGAAVTLVDRQPQAGRGVTGGSFGWIGDEPGDAWPGGAADLRPLVRDDYRRLEATVPGFAVRWCGSLRWPGSALTPAHITPAQITRLEQHLVAVPASADFTPGDGAVDPVGLTAALVSAAESLGARVSLRSTFAPPAGSVVLAAGTGVTALSARLGAPVVVPASPALLVRVAGPPGAIRTIAVGPDFEARELADGSVLMAVTLDATAEPSLSRAAPRHHPGPREPWFLAELAVRRLRTTFEGDFRLVGWQVSERPMPAGGPVIGPLTPDVYVAVMHSGVTLAPTVGRLVAEELVSGRPAPELARCRPPQP
ncbi:NAD(P)/FAD-dependent oxidoreductase [Paractinoplanes rishiriensis]|uniref:D-amino-acid oxidase n=1 Tax=Paractinoplanes rishiriensis TaxID=1050105 RepID=A0A919K1Y0_9ACTN|nr:FAD-dependent oxidoreductase [Actinoplanes rishiriensis]GIE98773.1 D-amino-acid oxidase [Actinoplanes rishiriensis]